MFKLVPLRIPEGWRVVRNNFKEFYPAKKALRSDDKKLLSEDMLILLYDAPTDSESAQTFKVNVGWCSRRDSTGDFLVSFHVDEKMILLVNVHSIAEAAKQVEEWVVLEFIQTYQKDTE